MNVGRLDKAWDSLAEIFYAKVLARIIKKIVCETKLTESSHQRNSPGPSHSQVTMERTAESVTKFNMECQRKGDLQSGRCGAWTWALKSRTERVSSSLGLSSLRLNTLAYFLTCWCVCINYNLHKWLFFHDVVYIAMFLKVDIDIKLFFIRTWKMCTLETKLKKGDEKYDKNV